MRLGALEACPEVFSIAPAASTKLLWDLHLRGTGAVRGFAPSRSRPRSWIFPRKRPFASFSRLHLLKGGNSGVTRDTPQQEETSGFVRGPKKREPEAWVAVLDHYLPQDLRTSTRNSGDGIENTDPMAIEAVPLVLDRARQAAKVDLLCFIGVYQERWKAVHWLVTTMLAKCPSYVDMNRRMKRLPTVLWDTNGPGLHEITCQYIKVENPKRSPIRFDALVGNNLIGTQQVAVAQPRQILGALWQSLGSMLLEIEDRSSDNPNRPLILSHVLWILAEIHHRALLPDTIYNYDQTENKSTLRRPPMLYLISEKILADLSDTFWRTHWAHDAGRVGSDGRELSLPTVPPQMPRMGPEVWLELLLWICIEGGWISDAAWLVSEMQRRRDNPERRWSVIGWDQISPKMVQELGWIGALKRELDRSRFNQATEVAVANRHSSNTSPEMGTRKISREVVLAIADGLANLVTDNHLLGNTIAKVQNHIADCQALLARGQLAMDPGHANTLILRALETSGINARLQPGYLQMLLALRPAEQSSSPSPPSSHFVSRTLMDVSAPILGLQHKLLNSYARLGNLKGSLQSLKFIQEGIDSNRDIHIQDFADELTRNFRQGPRSGEISKSKPQQTPRMLYPDIPSYVLEAFFDLLVDSKEFELGHWVLFNDDIDGGILSPNSFSNVSVQPALLRFATATANEELILKVLEYLETPLPEPTLHALLRCQIAVNRWDGVEGILKLFRDTQDMAWTPSDAMAIAAAITNMEWKDDARNVGHSLHAKRILQDLVQGEFNSPQNHAQIPNLLEIRTANQLGRIFQSVTGALGTTELGPQGYLGRANYSVRIPSDAFNILLASVIEGHGSLAGIKLWEQWCLEPDQANFSDGGVVDFPNEDGCEKVVQPTVSMLRLVLRPVTESLKDSVYSSIAKKAPENSLETNTDQDVNAVEHIAAGGRVRDSLTIPKDSLSVFDWCIKVYRKFGFSDRDILREIPPSFGRIIEM